VVSAVKDACSGAVEQTPSQVVWRRGPVRLLRYRTSEPAGRSLPVVLVPSIINRSYVLDLRPGQSFVQHLLARGLDVYMLDWGEPRGVDRDLGLDDYAWTLLRQAVRRARQASGAERVHLLGYCLGGTFSLIAGALGLPGVASIVALTTPVEMGDPGSMRHLIDERLVDLERLARAFPIVPGQALWTAFQSLDPFGTSRKARTLYARRKDEEFVTRFKAQETWLADSVPMTARVLRDVVGGLYRRNALPLGTLRVAGRPVRLADGRVPVLNLIAAHDTVVPPAASRPLAELWGGPVETHEIQAGHIGITVGSKAPTAMWAVVSEWLQARRD
jgi:poly[(R)-3-hydroxyalkanoate] polymerase subunit PhaC